MNKKNLIAMAMLIVMAATSLGQTRNYVPERDDYTFKARVCATSDDDGQCFIADSVITTVTDKMGHSFTLVSTTQPLDTIYWKGFGEIREDDINFDGTSDLMICLGPTNGYGCFTYDGYVWDNAEHKFKRVEEFDKIMDPVFQPENNQILGSFRIGNHYWTSRYEWQNGELVLIEEDDFELDFEE
ncbi:MAG: hypothetical protein IJ613_12040 [Muribaculaceae bacterium]|nr:hypothetical protein [Muribaculaceae bacterium]